MSQAAHSALVDDPVLGPIVDAHGPITLDRAEDPFQRLVVSILRQQVSMASAAAMRERLFERVEVTPGSILAADEETLKGAGLSDAKVEYVRAAARAFDRRPLGDGYFDDRSDEEVIAELSEIRGIGPWTAKMFLIFGLAREDVFPVEDLGIRKGMRDLFEEDLSRAEMVERAEPWRPYRTYASKYIWRAYE
ncbi:MAG: DNA-3-methyladenine glycosylase [Halodesulfurarchaeum sp.]